MNISSLFYMNKTQHGPDSTTEQHTFDQSHVYLFILEERDKQSDINWDFHYQTPPIQSKLHQ